MLLTFVFIYGGLALFHSRSVLIGWLLTGLILEIVVGLFVFRLSKRQSIALKYVCPLCGGALYDGRENRLGRRGECPCCKKFIMDRL